MILHLSGTISTDDERWLTEILLSDPYYQTLYKEMAQIKALSFVPVLEKQKKSNYDRNIGSILFDGASVRSRFTFLYRMTAVLVLAFSLTTAFFYLNKAGNQDSKLAGCQTIVPFGSQTKLVLSDGTVVWLNSGSTLSYNASYGENTRDVYLAGEGYFEVHKNPKKPFIVHTNQINVKVLGTVFNVRSYTNEPSVQVDLLEGKVNVSATGTTNEHPEMTLLPDEKMIYQKDKKTMTSYKSNAARTAQWVTGKLCFVDASLESIAKDLERRFDIQIKLESNNIKNETFSGSINLNQPIGAILDYLDVDKKFAKIYMGRTIVIKNKNGKK